MLLYMEIGPVWFRIDPEHIIWTVRSIIDLVTTPISTIWSIFVSFTAPLWIVWSIFSGWQVLYGPYGPYFRDDSSYMDRAVHILWTTSPIYGWYGRYVLDDSSYMDCTVHIYWKKGHIWTVRSVQLSVCTWGTFTGKGFPYWDYFEVNSGKLR